ncbi:collagen alpha-1(III) chain-like [Sus scrofa]|uniref:collagen alpha-1(III) chain-like n=1 Tax=Sus scrofa TaxID=9823 RepID=UPI000A2B6C35|nr:collagen alpha-1(III) chain-like [Sus scrofa]
MPRAAHAPAGRGRARPGRGQPGAGVRPESVGRLYLPGICAEPGSIQGRGPPEVRPAPGSVRDLRGAGVCPAWGRSGAGVRPRSVQSRRDLGSVRSRSRSGSARAQSRAGAPPRSTWGRGPFGLRPETGSVGGLLESGSVPARGRGGAGTSHRGRRGRRRRGRGRLRLPRLQARGHAARGGVAWPPRPAPPPEPALLGPRGPPAAGRGGNPSAGPASRLPPPLRVPSRRPGLDETGGGRAGRPVPAGFLGRLLSFRFSILRAPPGPRGGGSGTCAGGGRGRGARAPGTWRRDRLPGSPLRAAPPSTLGRAGLGRPPPRGPRAFQSRRCLALARTRLETDGDAAGQTGPRQPAEGPPSKRRGDLPAEKWDRPAVGKSIPAAAGALDVMPSASITAAVLRRQVRG